MTLIARRGTQKVVPGAALVAAVIDIDEKGRRSRASTPSLYGKGYASWLPFPSCALAHMELKKTGAFVVHGLAKFTVYKKPARPARKGINPFTKQEHTFAAKTASKASCARAAKSARDAVG